jgi:hypothetical protein
MKSFLKLQIELESLLNKLHVQNGDYKLVPALGDNNRLMFYFQIKQTDDMYYTEFIIASEQLRGLIDLVGAIDFKEDFEDLIK